jgi:hypothetical protein
MPSPTPSRSSKVGLPPGAPAHIAPNPPTRRSARQLDRLLLRRMHRPVYHGKGPQPRLPRRTAPRAEQ